MEKASAYYESFQKHFCVGKLIIICHPAERYNVNFGFSRVQVETTGLKYPALPGFEWIH